MATRPRRPDSISLTADLVAHTLKVIEDPGPDPALAYHTDEDFADLVRSFQAEAEAEGRPVWLFAYGSLIWKPACATCESRIGTVRGWHRSFCLRLTRWRGTKDRPGLMMALDRGGTCRGVAYRLPEENLAENLDKVLRREMSVKPANNLPRWLTVHTGHGESLRAIGFVMNRNGAYVGRQPLEQTAAVLARAVGHLGSCAEYLHNTVVQLEAHGIRDRNLWKLQQLVAEEILKEHGRRGAAAE